MREKCISASPIINSAKKIIIVLQRNERFFGAMLEAERPSQIESRCVIFDVYSLLALIKCIPHCIRKVPVLLKAQNVAEIKTPSRRELRFLKR